MRFNLCFSVPKEYEESRRGLEDQTRSKLQKPRGRVEGGREGEAFLVIAIVKPRRSVTTTNPPTHKMKIVVQSKY